VSYYWQLKMHLNGGDRHTRLEDCPELGICRQTVIQRKGYRIIEQLHFFADETKADDPVYTLKEILLEAEYRKAIREQDAVELEAISGGSNGCL
jgi:hypothetical protein